MLTQAVHAAEPAPSESPARISSSVQTSQVLALLPQPLLALGQDCQVVFANARAERLIETGGAVLRSGALQQLGQLDALRLRELVALAAGGAGSRTGLWFAPSLETGWLHAATLAPRLAGACGWGPAQVLLTVQMDQPALTQASRIEALSRQCQLSVTERQVLLLLADGDAAESVARHMDVRLSTVRTHVRNLLGKTQAPTLMQLLRWVGSAAPLQH